MNSRASEPKNIDWKTVEGFGEEETYDQLALGEIEHRALFDAYFSVFPFDLLAPDAEGFDLGCGSGRWAAIIADRVGTIHCIDPSQRALEVAKRRLGTHPAARFHLASSDSIPLADGSQDFGYSLGVLHHIPDAEAALMDCVRKLKPSAPFLIYLYYAFDNRPAWFRRLWQVSELGRRTISRLPFRARKVITATIATLIYWPLAKVASSLGRAGVNVSTFPLSAYRHASFYTMRTDALDRFGTRLEHRFTRDDIRQMMERAGLCDVRFREEVPYWVACGRRGLA